MLTSQKHHALVQQVSITHPPRQNTASNRLISLDVFRGLTIVLMIIVNSPGNQSPYSWLAHSLWDGCTLADWVFPFFLVILGVSTVLALSGLQSKGIAKPRLVNKVVRRSAYIFLMGLLLNAFPNHFDIFTIRILGVLQRIGICYLVVSLLYLTTTIRMQCVLMLMILVGYGLLMLVVPAMHLNGEMIAYVDQLLLGQQHLYTPSFEPEGVISTIPAIASALMGNLVGALLISSRTKSEKILRLLLSGIFLLITGWMFSAYIPLNKSLWSSTYVIWTAGLAILVYTFLYSLIEILGFKKWAIPFEIYGRHALLVYMLHVLGLKIQAMIKITNMTGEMVGVRLYITDVLFGSLSPQNASLCYSVCYVLLWLMVLVMIDFRSSRR